jgi:hypothetical protein
LADDLDGRLVLELADQRFEPSRELGLVLAKEGPAYGGQPPAPHRSVGNDRRACGLARTSAQGLGTLSLAFGFAIGGGAGQSHAGEVFEHGAGFLDG